MSFFDTIKSFKAERLVNYNTNRIEEYNERVKKLEENRDLRIQNLEDDIEQAEISEQRAIIRAEEKFDQSSKSAEDRAILKNAKLSAKRDKRQKQLKAQRNIKLIQRRFPERLLNDTKQDRQTMYYVATWAAKYRTERETVKYFGDDGKIAGRVRQSVWATINLPTPYPTSDLKIYEANFWEKCIETYRVVCQDPPPWMPPNSPAYKNYVRCQVVKNLSEDWDCRD